jgi:hypothetical protein
MIGQVEIANWRTVAADVDGVPQPEKIGQLTEQRRALFAYRSEVELWINEMAAQGFDDFIIASAATSYFGPTDAPGNCWSVTVERIIAS